ANPAASTIDACSPNSGSRWHLTISKRASGQVCDSSACGDERSGRLLRLAPLAAQPFSDGLPLFPLGSRQVLREFEHTHAARVGTNVILGFAQTPQVRDFELG